MASMSISLLRNDLNSSEQHRLVRATRRVFAGAAAGVPTPNILRFQDVGLLYFLNQKQSKFHAVLANVDLDAHEALLPVRNLVNFVTTAVGWLIVEAERIDEAIVATQRDLSNIGNALRESDLDLQYQSARSGTDVMQAIAEHHRSRVNVPQRSKNATIEQFDESKAEALNELPTRIVNLRTQFQACKAHLNTLKITQRLLQGNRNAQVPQVEADAIVTDLSALTTMRKAAHRVRDAVFDVPNREKLEAISSLLEVFAYIDRGLTAALDDLEHCQIGLKKAVLLSEKETKMSHLDAVDARNKQLSSAALRQNEELGQDVGRVALTHSHIEPAPADMSQQLQGKRQQKKTPSRLGPNQHSLISPGLTPVAAGGGGGRYPPFGSPASNPAGDADGGYAAPAIMASPASAAGHERGVSVASHGSEMDDFLQRYCS